MGIDVNISTAILKCEWQDNLVAFIHLNLLLVPIEIL